MLEIIKRVTGGVIVGLAACTVGRAIHLYGEKKYLQGKVVGYTECACDTIERMSNKDDSEVESQETEEA